MSYNGCLLKRILIILLIFHMAMLMLQNIFWTTIHPNYNIYSLPLFEMNTSILETCKLNLAWPSAKMCKIEFEKSNLLLKMQEIKMLINFH